MILLVDIGNTEIKLGVLENDELIKKFRIKTIRNSSIDEYAIKVKALLNSFSFEGVVISSVVPTLTTVFKGLFKKYYNIEPIILGPGVKTGIKIKTDNPKEVGSDLVACAVGAVEKYGSDVLVIDLGTASKFIHICNKILDGVVIATGVEVSARALTNNASLLPDFELKAPKSILGTNTIECLQSGIIYGASAQVDGIIYRIKRETRNKDLKVIITGGLAKMVSNHCFEDITYDENLLFKGLELIYKRNTNNKVSHTSNL